MLAYVLEGFDRPPVFADVPRPAVRAGEALVRVEATSVNPYDDLVARGMLRDRLEHRFPAVFGRDVAGVVEEVAAGVERLAVGDAVFGFIKRDYIGDGGFAEYVSVPADRYVTHRPSNLDVTEAGALGLASITALQCLDTLRVTQGTTLFVNGATGGVGSFAVQIARSLGAHVVATARPGGEEEHARSLGAGTIVDWSAGEVARAVRAAVPDGVDALLDLISTEEALPRFAAAVLRPGGRAATTRVNDPAPLEGATIEMVHSVADLESLERIARLVEAGEVKVPVTHRFAFRDLPAAFDKLREGAIGKIAVAGPAR